jgi:hypothetical protein
LAIPESPLNLSYRLFGGGGGGSGAGATLVVAVDDALASAVGIGAAFAGVALFVSPPHAAMTQMQDIAMASFMEHSLSRRASWLGPIV